MPESPFNPLKTVVTLLRLLPRRLAVTFGVGVGIVILTYGCSLVLDSFIGDVSDPTLRLFLAAPFYATFALGALGLAFVIALLLAGLIEWWRRGGD